MDDILEPDDAAALLTPEEIRDLAALTACGYGIAAMTLVDLFPQTFHLETVGAAGDRVGDEVCKRDRLVRTRFTRGP